MKLLPALLLTITQSIKRGSKIEWAAAGWLLSRALTLRRHRHKKAEISRHGIIAHASSKWSMHADNTRALTDSASFIDKQRPQRRMYRVVSDLSP